MPADKLHTGPQAAAPPRAEGARVDVVIVSADMGEMTLACLEALDFAGSRAVVVDNAPDRAHAGGGLAGANCTIVAGEEPLGFAAANNLGIAVGDAPLVLLLNSDIVAVPGAIDTLARGLLDDPGAVAAGGRLVDPDTLVTQSAYKPRRFPTLLDLLVVLFGIEELWPGNPVTRAYHGASHSDERIEAVEQPAAAALLVRRSALAAVGGFDERFWFWFEDSDLLRRLSRLGRVLYVPQAVFRHTGGGTFSRWSKSQRIRSIHHGMLHYGSVHFSAPRRIALGLAAAIVSLPRVLLFARSRPEEAAAWRAVLGASLALTAGREIPAIAPGPTVSR